MDDMSLSSTIKNPVADIWDNTSSLKIDIVDTKVCIVGTKVCIAGTKVDMPDTINWYGLRKMCNHGQKLWYSWHKKSTSTSSPNHNIYFW